MPSVDLLSDSMVELLRNSLQVHASFNFGQMMQGENLPSHVRDLQVIFREHDRNTFKFFLVSLVGIFSSLTGNVTVDGCLIMSRANGAKVMRCIYCLQSLSEVSPHAIYWSYISSYARSFGQPSESDEDLLIARLAC